MNTLRKYKFEIFLSALLLQIVFPFFSHMLTIPDDTLRFVTFTILVLASFLLANRNIPRVLVLLFGSLSTIAVWCNFMIDDFRIFQDVRIYATCFFYITLIYILVRNFLDAKAITLPVIIGAICGYLLIGFLGASFIELIEYQHPGSFKFPDAHEAFDYYYFSFISLVTVGFGDIIPLSYPAKSLTVLISLIGQLYLAIGIASFVGKFMNK